MQVVDEGVGNDGDGAWEFGKRCGSAESKLDRRSVRREAVNLTDLLLKATEWRVLHDSEAAVVALVVGLDGNHVRRRHCKDPRGRM